MKEQGEGEGGIEEEEREGNWEGRRYFEGKLKAEGGRCSRCGRRNEKIIFLRPLPQEHEKTFGAGLSRASKKQRQ